ncbi:DUF6907 domain-containing protein [Streptomyces sp. NPDC015680]|uniref:DUF6907 domain-containing protein n=1 Tax=unclassified Streptomyces TaxID=2593676 RepID=UPI0036FD7C57
MLLRPRSVEEPQSVPTGKAARATRRVSAGTLPAPPVASTSAGRSVTRRPLRRPAAGHLRRRARDAADAVLAGRINVDPYSEDPRRNVPHIHLEPFQDEVMECLDPQEFDAVIAQVRAHCERLDEVHTQLVMARAEYR